MKQNWDCEIDVLETDTSQYMIRQMSWPISPQNRGIFQERIIRGEFLGRLLFPLVCSFGSLVTSAYILTANSSFGSSFWSCFIRRIRWMMMEKINNVM